MTHGLESRLEDIRVVLARPQDSRNVGAVCRAMKTMGLRSLYVTGGSEINRQEAGPLALHADDMLDGMRRTPRLEDAVADCALVAGFSRRQGKWRKYHNYTPRQFGRMITKRRSGAVALVFGNEASGLSDEELAVCNVAVTIPTSPAFPSLNLSHAVQIAVYEIYQAIMFPKDKALYSPVTSAEIAELCGVIGDSLSSIGFFHVVPPEDMVRFFRDIFARAGLSTGEAERMANIFEKIAGIVRGRESSSPRSDA